jgi:hypothetical protein
MIGFAAGMTGGLEHIRPPAIGPHERYGEGTMTPAEAYQMYATIAADMAAGSCLSLN